MHFDRNILHQSYSASVNGMQRIMRGCHRRDEVRGNDVGCRTDHGVEMCYCDTGTDRELSDHIHLLHMSLSVEIFGSSVLICISGSIMLMHQRSSLFSLAWQTPAMGENSVEALVAFHNWQPLQLWSSSQHQL